MLLRILIPRFPQEVADEIVEVFALNATGQTQALPTSICKH